MTNYQLIKKTYQIDEIGYRKYLRCESIKSLFDRHYVADKSSSTFQKSKHYKSISYSDYIVENLDKTISYTEYLSENIDNNISYSDYLSEEINKNYKIKYGN